MANDANDAYEVVGEDGMGEDPPNPDLGSAVEGWGTRKVDADELNPATTDTDPGGEDDGIATGDEGTNTGEVDPEDSTSSGDANTGEDAHSGDTDPLDDKLDSDLSSSEVGGDIELRGEDGLDNDLTPSDGGGDTITGDVGGTGYRRDKEATLLLGSV